MKTSDNFTERQKQYLAAPRAINNEAFPTPGFYFIRRVKEEQESSGNIYPYGLVNWKLKENDVWEDCTENRFNLRLDYLLEGFNPKTKISYDDLRHQVIQVKSAYIRNMIVGGKSFSKLIVDWEITHFQDIFDALPYFSLFNSLIELMEDHKLAVDKVDMLAICSDEFMEDEEDEHVAGDYADEDDLDYPTEY